MSKAYKFTVDPGYLHDIKGNVHWLNNFLLSIVTRGNSIIFHSYLFFTNFRRRKSEFKLLSINEKERATPHLGVSSKRTDGSLFGRCSCVAGAGGYCHHVIGLLYYLALVKLLRHHTLPDELTCTSMKQCWSIPRGKRTEQKEIPNLFGKKPQLGASYNKFIESNLYSPS